jgi:membrane peptidoglycan carboxypeptidase
MIGAMIPSPNVFSPVKHPARAMQRRNTLLERMLRLSLIEQREFQAAAAEPFITGRPLPSR